jgi:hypothetical protein
MKYSSSKHSCITVEHKNFTCERDRGEEADQVVKWLEMGKRRLVNRDTRMVLSALSSTNNKGVRYFDQAWLRKATDIVGNQEK